ncbi:ubiquitin 3 binding protein But2 C-terminal domain-containing protein [Dipodascopsis tothii]|uniref:ubiquitin 3 binding protein But2 C-terminal domain-containing protein n=1 Tax=Dipodascopsis tothii TaxID=44089 RepID=UPI0034CE7424
MQYRTIAALVAAAVPAVLADCSFPDKFSLSANTSALGQISDGQIRTSLGQIYDGQIRTGNSTTCLTLTSASNGTLQDIYGRPCYVTPYHQFECTAALQDTATPYGFCTSGDYLTYNGSSTFYACDTGVENQSNIYVKSISDSACKPIDLILGNAYCTSGSCSASTVVSTAVSTVTEASTVTVTGEASTVTVTGEAGTVTVTESCTGSTATVTGSASVETVTVAGSASVETVTVTGSASVETVTVVPSASVETVTVTAVSESADTVYVTKSAAVPTTVTVSATETEYSAATATVVKTSIDVEVSSAVVPTTIISGTTLYSTVVVPTTVVEASTAVVPTTVVEESTAVVPTTVVEASTATISVTPTPASSSVPATTTSSTPVSSTSSSSCAASTSIYPNLIVPINNQYPDTSLGTQYWANITKSGDSEQDVLLEYDVPSTYTGECVLKFNFPDNPITFPYYLEGDTRIEIYELEGTFTEDATWNDHPATGDLLDTVTLTRGGYAWATASKCNAGSANGYLLKCIGDCTVEYFIDYNPPPVGTVLLPCE